MICLDPGARTAFGRTGTNGTTGGLYRRYQMSVANGAIRLNDRQCRMLPTDPEGPRQQDCHNQLREECLTALEG